MIYINAGHFGITAHILKSIYIFPFLHVSPHSP